MPKKTSAKASVSEPTAEERSFMDSAAMLYISQEFSSIHGEVVENDVLSEAYEFAKRALQIRRKAEKEARQ